jgi:hypothetical protein
MIAANTVPIPNRRLCDNRKYVPMSDNANSKEMKNMIAITGRISIFGTEGK